MLAFDGAHFHDCLGALHGNQSFAGSILRARTLLRLNKPGDAVAALPVIASTNVFGHAQLGEALIIKAAACMRLSAFTDAHDALADAWVHVVSSGSIAMEAEFEYYGALLAWMLGRYEGAADGAARVEEMAVPEEAWLQPSEPYIVSLAATQARALELRAFEAGRVGKLQDQLRFLRRGLAVLRSDARPDCFVEAGLLRNLAVVVRELGALSDAEAIGKRILELEWTEELGEHRYHIVRSLGWCRALAGDHVGALRRFREAAKLAITPAWQLFAVVDRAYLAVELGQHIFADEEIAHALDLSLTIDWSKTIGEESAALLMLAQLVATRDAAEATRILERYRLARAGLSRLAFAPLDPRVKASEFYAQAQIALGRGDREAAATLLTDAFRTWDRIGSKWRAALAAGDLARLVSDERYARYADREAQRRPLSWLALRRSTAA